MCGNCLPASREMRGEGGYGPRRGGVDCLRGWLMFAGHDTAVRSEWRAGEWKVAYRSAQRQMSVGRSRPSCP
eukprot:7385244-Prymnesium_polylepis.1